MGSTHILSYASTHRVRRPLHPIYGMLALIASVEPFVAAYFLIAEGKSSAGIWMGFGTLFSPLTLTASVFLVRRYRGYAKRRTVAAIACALSGLTVADFVVVFLTLLLFGVPC